MLPVRMHPSPPTFRFGASPGIALSFRWGNPARGVRQLEAGIMANDIAAGELAGDLEKVLSGTVIDPLPVALPAGASRTLAPMRRMGVPGYSITNG
jgi:hypothetical protein